MGVLDALNLDGKNVVITGGGTGLGLEMVRGMAEAGANIAIAGRRQGPIDEAADMVKGLGRKSMAVSTDVTDTAAVNALFETVLAEWGAVHILFLNTDGTVLRHSKIPYDDSFFTNNEQTAGKYSVSFSKDDGATLASGLYIVRLQVGERSETLPISLAI